MIVKEYIKYDLCLVAKRKYVEVFFRGDYGVGLAYIEVVFDLMTIDEMISCAGRSSKGYRDDSVSINIVYDNDIKLVEITHLDLVNPGESCQPHYVLSHQDFAAVVKKYKYCLDNNISHFYLILLQGNRVILQEELSGKNLIMPKKWLEYVKVAYVEEDSWCTDVEWTSSDLGWLSRLYFHLNSHEKIFEWFEVARKKGKVPSHISIDDVKRLIEEWEVLRSKECPVYFVKQDDGSITVRKSILDLKHIKLALSDSGEYKIVDECGVEVFDLLEEFALGFSPKDFLEKIDSELAVEGVLSCKYGNIEIVCSKKEDSIVLNLGKAPREFEHIETDRARYKENRSVKMSLDDFKGLVSYWFSLQQKQVPEIYFTQKEDGAIVVRESLN